ncbi:MAG TPA: hypothetical protein VGS80_08870 [Ktedonobacterales bacterium]|nr:hypothetical protein [Ktedonobacterales bacterium]
MLTDPQTRWQPARLRWYEGTPRTLQWTSGTALWYRGGIPPLPIRWVLTRDPAGKHKPKAYFSTTPEQAPEAVLAAFLKRWPIAVTFEEVRAHLGMATQRQWSDRAIVRETPCVLGLYSLVARWGKVLSPTGQVSLQSAVWYATSAATFSDVLSAVRRHLWEHQ